MRIEPATWYRAICPTVDAHDNCHGPGGERELQRHEVSHQSLGGPNFKTEGFCLLPIDELQNLHSLGWRDVCLGIKRMTARILTSAGIRTLEARNGEQALMLLTELGPNVIGLVVSDVAMPGITGAPCDQGLDPPLPSLLTKYEFVHEWTICRSPVS